MVLVHTTCIAMGMDAINNTTPLENMLHRSDSGGDSHTQQVLEAVKLRPRMELALTILKKEHAIVDLQAEISQQIEAKVNFSSDLFLHFPGVHQ